MPFKKGEGGRQRGIKNHVRRNVQEIFRALGGVDGEDYAQELHDLACGAHGDLNAKLRALAIIAPYLWGQPKGSVNITGSVALMPVRVIHEYRDGA